MNNKLKQLFIALPLTVLSTTAAANWSTTITAASDYTSRQDHYKLNL